MNRQGDTGFTYDADGNLIQKAIGLDITTFTYNTDNKLISVDGPEGLTEYQYNGLGDLTAVTKNGIKTHYLLLFYWLILVDYKTFQKSI